MSQYRQQGSVAYLISIVLVAVIGGLLFGYDTAVISGAEKGLQAFFENAKDFAYTNAMHGFTTSSALIGCVIGALVSGRLAISFGRKRTLFIAGILFLLSALGSWYPEFLFFEKGVPTAGLLIAFNAYRGCTLPKLHLPANGDAWFPGTSLPSFSVSWWCISSTSSSFAATQTTPR